MKRVCGNGLRSRRVVATASLFLAFVLTVAAGTGRSVAQVADAPGEATLRVLHGVSDAGPLDLSIDGALALIGTTFPSVSDALPVAGGEPRLVVAPSGVAAADDALLDAPVEVGAGTAGLLALFGGVGEFSAVLYSVDTGPIAADTARLRVIHGSLDAGPVDPAIVGGEVLFPTLDYLDATTYAELPAGSYAFQLLVAGTGDVALDLGTVDLAAGAAYDLVAVGQVADGTLQPLVLETAVEIAATDDETPDDDEAEDEDDAAGDEQAADVAADAADAATRPVALRAGDCADPTGDVVAELQAASPPGGAEVGAADDATVEQAFSVAPVPFETITGAEHVVTVGTPGGADGGVAACGGVAGRLTADGALVVALRPISEAGVTGVAVLAPNVLDPTATDVSVFLTPGLNGAEASSAALEAPTDEAASGVATPDAAAADSPEVELIDATPFAE